MSNESVPLFPLGTVLYPGGLLPLQIFEVRYLDMIRKCLNDNTGFGIVSLLAGAEVRRPQEQLELGKYGTWVEIDKIEAQASTLMKITVKGMHRFELLSSAQQKNGLWTGVIKPLPADTVVEIPDDLQASANALSELITTMEEKEVSGDRLPFQMPYRLMDCGWVANRWCEILPLEQTVKVQLLALDNPLLRLELITDFLEQYKVIKP